MTWTDNDSTALEALVGELESESSVEVVVAVARQSGSYGDIDMAAPVVCAWVMMGVLVFSPLVFPDWSLLPCVLAAFLTGLGLSKIPALRARLPAVRSRRQVEDAARAVFFREHVSATTDRTGILIYLSLRESAVEILADYGVQSVIPEAHWNGVLDKVRKAAPAVRCQTLMEALRSSAPLLAEKLPRTSDDRDELSNAPRVLQ